MKSASERRSGMLSGSIWDKILLFALPLAATSILQQVFNAADVAVVGRFVGNAAQAAVGSNGPIIGLLVNLFIGLSLGTNVLVSQYIGAGNEGGVRKTVHTSIILGVVGGVALAVLGWFISSPVVTVMDVPEDVHDMAVLYLRIYLMGMPVILLYNFLSAVFRAQGDTKTPLIVLFISGVVNVALNLLFVVGLHMTVDGVAIATVVSNLVSSAVLLWLLIRGQGQVKVELKYMRVDWFTLRRIIQVGLPAGVQSMVFSIANITIQRALNSLGTVVMAGSSAANYVESFTYSVLSAFGQAITTFVGQNCGAGDLDRCRRSLRVTLLVGYIFFGAAVALLLIFATPLLRIFNSDPAVIENGLIRIRYMFIGHTFSLAVEVLSGYMRGFGYSLVPALCSLVFVCGSRFFWVFVVFPANPTFGTLMMVYPVSLSITAAVIATACFLSRKKMYAHVRQPRGEEAAEGV